MNNTMVELPRKECLRLLATNQLGRVVVGTPYGAPLIRPVNYAFDERAQAVVFRTARGSKFHALLDSARAAFEIDGFDERSRTGWSVILSGVAGAVTDATEIRRLDRHDLEAWAPGPKRHWIQIRAWTVSGRRIVARGESR